AAIGFGINMAVTLVLFLGASSQTFQNTTIRAVVFALSKIRVVKNFNDTYTHICNLFTDFREKFKILITQKELFIKCSLCNIVKMTCLYSMPFFACKAVHLEAHFPQYIQFMALASIIHLLNAFLPVPGASGGSEGSFIVLFGFLGSQVSSAMLLWRIFAFYYGALLGLVIFILSQHQIHLEEEEES
ncbi:MAG: lysylphosphatidylglycerol synthase domain-containing protein, partial [bacterium]